MIDKAKTVAQVKALQSETKEHKAELKHHRRALRAKMKRLEELKQFCRMNNIGLQINGVGE